MKKPLLILAIFINLILGFSYSEAVYHKQQPQQACNFDEIDPEQLLATRSFFHLLGDSSEECKHEYIIYYE